MHLGLTIENSVITAAVVTNDGDFVWQSSCPVSENGLPSLLTSCTTLVTSASRDNPGLHQTIGISAQNSLIDQLSPRDGPACLASLDLGRNLQASLGRPVVLASPGQALALYESCFGNAQQSDVTCCLFLDDHVYGGVAVGQKLLRGANNIVGAWGHMPLAWPVPHELEGRDCWCGRSGCLEEFLSLGGLENEYFTITQTKLDIQAIANAADANDLVASSVLQVLDDRIGRTTAAIINMFDPDVIILGGRIAGLNRLYLNVPRKWPGYLLIERSKTQLLKASHATFAVAKGAAWLAASQSAS
jgi:fructokinase